MRTVVGDASYKLPDSERRYVELLAADEDLKWIRRDNCLCGSKNTCQILDRDRFGLSFDIRLCEDCGLIYFAETLDEASMGKYYNKYFYPLTSTALYGYDSHDDRGVFCQYKFIEPHIIARYSGGELAILDVGAGAGKLLMTLAKNFSRIDIVTNLSAFEPIESWWPLYTEKGIKAIKSLTEEANVYDLIILSETLEHLADPIGYLKLLRNLLSPSGIMFIEVPGIFNSHNFGDYIDVQYACPHFHVQLFSALSLTNVAILAGLEPIEVTELIRGTFCRGDSATKISGALLSSNAQRIRAYLSYVKAKKDKFRSKQEFYFDPWGREPKLQPEIPARDIPMLIMRKIKRRILTALKSRKLS